MKLSLTKLPETVNMNFKGGEGALITKSFKDDKNNIMFGRLTPTSSVGYHKHETNSEILYVLQGNAVATIDGEEETLAAGVCHYCPKGHSHGIVNNGNVDFIFVAVVPEQ